ncbi:MAG: flagella basal body P-ring formation protein FlgA [Phenylobacterium sp.]|jgi:flagella basal body P-ring formation protein FlgA
MKLLNFFINNAIKTVICTICGLTLNLAMAQGGYNKAQNSQQETAPSKSQRKALQKAQKKRIEQLAVSYVESLFPAPDMGELTYSVVPLDKRIKIKSCDDQLKLSIPGSATLSKRTTVLVRCGAEKSWNLYVQVKIVKLMPVVVARINLNPGVVISRDNVTVMLKDANQIRGRTLQKTTLLQGAKTSRHISAGQPVTLRQVCLVCQGDSVTIVAKIKGIQIKTTGIAQQSGSLGDNIVILNPSSNKRIDGRVIAVNRVEINM